MLGYLYIVFVLKVKDSLAPKDINRKGIRRGSNSSVQFGIKSFTAIKLSGKCYFNIVLSRGAAAMD